MKKLFLTGIAALFLATGAPAEEPPGHQLAFEAFAKNVWRFNDYKKCTAQVEFTIPPNPKDWLLRTDLSLANDAAEVVFDRTHLGRVLINNSGPDVRFRGQSGQSPSRARRLLLSSRPEESHPRALPDPCMNLSIHTAPDVRPLPWHSCQ